MATDVNEIIKNLSVFYDFKGKEVLHVGAGGGQFMDYTAVVKKVHALDINREALKAIQEYIDRHNLAGKVSVMAGDFYDLSIQVDLVFFEFCLHEMEDPALALKKAGKMAPETLIIDHGEYSKWAWYVCENHKAKRSWQAAKDFGCQKTELVDTVQSFGDYQELHQKVEVMGDESIQRISEYKEAKNITLPMTYKMALIKN